MAVPTLEQLNQKIAEARAAQVDADAKLLLRDAATAAATAATTTYNDAVATAATQYQQAKDLLQEYVSGLELVPDPEEIYGPSGAP